MDMINENNSCKECPKFKKLNEDLLSVCKTF